LTVERENICSVATGRFAEKPIAKPAPTTYLESSDVMPKEPFTKFHSDAGRGFFANSPLIAAGIVCVGLLAVAAAIGLRAESGIQDLAGPIRAAGIFAFLGCALLVAVRLVEMHRTIDSEVDKLKARAKASDEIAEAAEKRLEAKRKENHGASARRS
jgi:hypothetical protein